MPGRCWLLVIALGLIGGATLAQPQINSPDQRTEKSAEPVQVKRQQSVTPLPIVKEVPRADLEQSEQKREVPDHKILGDTWPQWIMAVAALLGIGIALYTLELLRRTLIATRQAAQYADDAAKAAADAVTEAKNATQVTRDIGEAQVRAYLHIKSVAATFFSGLEEPSFEAIVVNTGQSPARDVVCGIQVRYHWAAVKIESELQPDWRNAVGKAVPTGGEEAIPAEIQKIAIAPEELASSEDKDFAAYMGVRVLFSYCDVFSRRWESEAYFGGFVQANTEEPRFIFNSKFKVVLRPLAKAQPWG